MRPSPHLHNVPIWSNKVSPQTFQTTLYARARAHTHTHFTAIRDLASLQTARSTSACHYVDGLQHCLRELGVPVCELGVVE
jgi:hypothetical protein